ncbi:helix-turn-helix domain-containing protein [Alicyclobacillus shizuokensis]|uniref:helix-turn-helix domain-containing protein n=1 Tax=Alicyclobacillus shizuokensis TaxID=392014 RepID=UPI00083166AB|nr:helix-turn-helix transcriptional regulator [Alicyclobacillus shizuokensis]
MPLRLAEWRKQKGWTQARLAKETGLSASAVAMYETGRRTPDAGALARLAAALGVSISDLTDAGADAAAKKDGVPAAGPTADAPPATSHASTAAEAPPGAWSPTTAIPLSGEEARIVLFLRLHPEAVPFLVEYVSAPEERRQQLEKTWQLIRNFPI